MGALDSVLSETGSRLGLSSSSAGSVLSGLLSFISQQDGGLSGFLGRFQRAGMGNTVSSWLGGDEKTITADNVENAMGSDAITNIASRAGLSFGAVTSAIAFMLPKLIQRLAPSGNVPTRLPAEIRSYISPPVAEFSSGVQQVEYGVERVAKRSGIERFIWPLVGLLLLILLGSWLWTRGRRQAFNAEEQARLATQKATAALTDLKPGFTGQDLVGALNLGVVNFPQGSAEIPAESHDFLNRAAVAVKTAPSGTVIEVGGYTDSTGDAASNLQLSLQRAEAVRGYLVNQGVDSSVLEAKGYGDTKPIATNETEEGRFRNRRIEFTVVK